MRANLGMTGREPYHVEEGHEWRRDCIAWNCQVREGDPKHDEPLLRRDGHGYSTDAG